MFRKFYATFIAAIVGVLFMGCGHATLNPQLKSQVDAEIAAVSGGQNATSPSTGTAKALAPGQWVKYRIIDENGEPSLLTYKVIGEEGDGIWLEYSVVSYYYSTVTRMLVVWEPRNLQSLDVKRIVEKMDDGAPFEYDPMMLAMSRPLYKRILSLLRQEWDNGANENVSVPAGHFVGCDRVTTDFYMGTRKSSVAYAHSEVPVCGIVKSESESSRMELLAYGFEGATPSF